jgi:hypothetical protein
MLTRALVTVVGAVHAVLKWVVATMLADDLPVARMLRRRAAERVSILLGRTVEDVERGVHVIVDDERQWVVSIDPEFFTPAERTLVESLFQEDDAHAVR